MFNIPNNITSSLRIFGSIYLSDAVIFIVVFLFVTALNKMIFAPFLIFYYIITLGFTFFLLSRSPSNPNMRNIKSIYLMIFKDRNVYFKKDFKIKEYLLENTLEK